MNKLPISADSHVTEPGNCYTDYIDPKYRDTAPHLVEHEKLGDIYVIDGLDYPIPLGLVAAAGKDPKDITTGRTFFGDLHRGGWDPKARAADQDRDGIQAEVIYPSVGMALCNHPDFDYKHACFEAYNRWLQEFCAGLPGRLFGMPQMAIRSVEDGIREVRLAKEMGFRGVMFPGTPAHEDYHHTDYDPLWETLVELDLPVSFHILTSRQDDLRKARGPKINSFQNIMRGNQDIIGVFVFGQVFERHPELKLVCVEADAGWVPHFSYRMDHIYQRHRYWMKCEEMARLPSEYLLENVYLTFQDDWTAFRFRDAMNVDRLMWANDFPHSDATWPYSQEMLAEHTADMTEDERDRILRRNVSELYGLDAA